jgi:hypothetical protein
MQVHLRPSSTIRSRLATSDQALHLTKMAGGGNGGHSPKYPGQYGIISATDVATMMNVIHAWETFLPPYGVKARGLFTAKSCPCF